MPKIFCWPLYNGEKKERKERGRKKDYSCDFGIGFFNLEMLTTILNLHRLLDISQYFLRSSNSYLSTINVKCETM